MSRIEEFDRELVLGKAMRIFWEKGYNGTSMQDLVDATGLNRSSIYNSFGSKANLYRISLEQYGKESSRIFQKALLKARDPLEGVRLIFESFLPKPNDDSDLGCFAMNCKAEMANRDENIAEWLVANQEYLLSLFRDLVTDGQKQSLMNKGQNADGYAYYILNAFQGFRMMGILVTDKKVMQQIIENTLTVLK